MNVPPLENLQPPPLDGVPLLDVSRQHAPLDEELTSAVLRVLRSGQYILGPDCEQLERRIAAYCQASHAIACASGSDALVLALMAAGVGAGDEVIVPSFTFFATAGAVSRLGATPVFVDIDPVTFNIDPLLVEPQITPACKAIIPVHLYGQCAEMGPICRLGRKYKIAVIEDAAQAIGAEYHGRRAGSLGDIACLSFYPTKNLGACGDAGLLTTCDEKRSALLKMLRVHGESSRYHHQLVGINSRLDSLQAAVLNVKLPHLERWICARQTNARRYTDLFTACGLARVLDLPTALPHCRHVWNQYVIRVPDGRRDALREHLAQHRIGTQIYYPVPLHRQECFESLKYQAGSLPETERAAAETLALPIFAELTAREQEHVVREIGTFFGIRSPAWTLRGPNFLRRGAQIRVSVQSLPPIS